MLPEGVIKTGAGAQVLFKYWSVVLADALHRAASLDAGLLAYETMRRPRTAWITQRSWLLSRVGELQSRLLCSLRDFAVKNTPETAMRRQMDQALSVDL